MRTRTLVFPLAVLLALCFLTGCGRHPPQVELQAAQDDSTNSAALSEPADPTPAVSVRTTTKTINSRIDVHQTTLNSSLTRVSGPTEVIQVNTLEYQSEPRIEVNTTEPAVRLVPAVPVSPLPVAAAPRLSDDQITRFYARSGSRMTINGTANMIQTIWRVRGDIIQGHLFVGSGFPTEPGQAPAAGPLPADVYVAIPANSLRGVDNRGTHFSDAFDNVMYTRLKADAFKKIEYHLTSLQLTGLPEVEGMPYAFDAQGELSIAGVTNSVAMPITVLPLGGGKLKITGTASVKMSSFRILVAPMLSGQMVVGDEVRLTFDWMLGERAR